MRLMRVILIGLGDTLGAGLGKVDFVAVAETG
jgi:hypothetical protein